MERQAKSFLQTYDFSDIIRAQFSASFFFELHASPAGRRIPFTCHGSIRCRSLDTSALIERILEEYPSACFTTGEGHYLGHIQSDIVCRICKRYDKHVAISVFHRLQNVSIRIKYDQLNHYEISGFPQSMSRLSTLQQLETPFGRSDHRVVNYAEHIKCKCVRSKKRKRV